MIEYCLLDHDEPVTVQVPSEATADLPEEAISLMCEYRLLHTPKGDCIPGEAAADAAHQLVIEYDRVVKRSPG